MKKMMIKFDLNALPMTAIEAVLASFQGMHALAAQYPGMITIEDDTASDTHAKPTGQAEASPRIRHRNFSPDPYRPQAEVTGEMAAPQPVSDAIEGLTDGQRLILDMIKKADKALSKAAIIESDSTLIPRDVGTWLYSLKSRKLIVEKTDHDGEKIYEVA